MSSKLNIIWAMPKKGNYMCAQTTTEMTPIGKMHDLRKRIDGIIQYIVMVKNDQRPEYSKGKAEITLAWRKLQEAKMWCGKVLEEFGSELPAQFQDKA